MSNPNAEIIRGLLEKLNKGDESCCKGLIDLWDSAREIGGAWGNPLHVAARKGYINICKIFCDAKIDLFIKDNNGKGLTALQLALREGKNDVASLLFERMFHGDAYEIGRFAVSNPKELEAPQPLVQIYAALLSNVDFRQLNRDEKNRKLRALPDEAIKAYGRLIQSLNNKDFQP